MTPRDIYKIIRDLKKCGISNNRIEYLTLNELLELHAVHCSGNPKKQKKLVSWTSWSGTNRQHHNPAIV